MVEVDEDAASTGVFWVAGVDELDPSFFPAIIEEKVKIPCHMRLILIQK